MEQPPDLEHMPGVGPIRARSLKKAGYGSVEALKTATPEQLAAVPGITEVKARQILEFVGSLGSPAPVPVAVPPIPAVEDAALEEVAAGDARGPLQVAAIKVAGAAGWLLQSPHAEGFCRVLARQLSKTAALVGRLAEGEAPAPEHEGRVLRFLNRIECILDEATANPRARSKQQKEMADRLRTRRRRLRKLLGPPA